MLSLLSRKKLINAAMLLVTKLWITIGLFLINFINNMLN